MRGKKANPLRQNNKRTAGSLRCDVSIVDRLKAEQIFDKFRRLIPNDEMHQWLSIALDKERDLSVAWEMAPFYAYRVRMLMVLPEEKTVERLNYWLNPLVDYLEKKSNDLNAPKDFHDIHAIAKTALSGDGISVGDWNALNKKMVDLRNVFVPYNLKQDPWFTKRQAAMFSNLADAYRLLLFGTLAAQKKALAKNKEPWVNIKRTLTNEEVKQVSHQVAGACITLNRLFDDSDVDTFGSVEKELSQDFVKATHNPFKRLTS